MITSTSVFGERCSVLAGLACEAGAKTLSGRSAGAGVGVQVCGLAVCAGNVGRVQCALSPWRWFGKTRKARRGGRAARLAPPRRSRPRPRARGRHRRCAGREDSASSPPRSSPSPRTKPGALCHGSCGLEEGALGSLVMDYKRVGAPPSPRPRGQAGDKRAGRRRAKPSCYVVIAIAITQYLVL